MLNQCTFIGNLGREPETRTFTNGNKVCNLRLAVSEKWKDKASGEAKERTEWVSVAIFQEGLIRVAEQYLHKGSKVYISGKFTTRKWQDKDGNDKYSTEIVLQGFDGKLVMLGGKQSEGGQQQADSGFGAGGNAMSDDIPFSQQVL
jgi:single-strand DNA-binding protein